MRNGSARRPSAGISRCSSTTKPPGIPNHGAIWTLFKERAAAGEIRKMVALDGHQGPKKINVQPEFFNWLTDPVKNGAGALFDFGCYGANLMTWLMDNQRPLAVSAVTQQFQPDVYPRVDDEATVVVEYPRALGIIQASWNWPFNRKDFEVYGDHGFAVATTGGAGLRVPLPNEPEHAVTPEDLPRDEHDSISHLIAVVRGRPAERAVVAREQPDRDRDSRGRAEVGAHACARGARAQVSQIMTISRREFLGAAGGAWFLDRSAPGVGRSGYVPASDKINIAFIGVGAQGLRVMLHFLREPDVQGVAVCDCNKSGANYPQWDTHEFCNSVRKLLGVDSWLGLAQSRPAHPTEPHSRRDRRRCRA